MSALGDLEARLEAPLKPLGLSSGTSKNARSNIPPLPTRPASRPASAPFGQDWHARNGQWRCETYIFPAASPRSIAGSSKAVSSSIPTSPVVSNQSHDNSVKSAPTRLSKEQVEDALQDIIDNQIKARQPVVQHTKDSSPLWIAVNKYSPKSSTLSSGHNKQKDPVTLIFAHANGFSKETWEATLMHLIENWNHSLCGAIEDIFVLDMVNQGDSALLNEHTLGNTFDWSDNGRDILQFVLSYLPPSKRDGQSGQHSSPLNSRNTAKQDHQNKPFFYSQDDASLSHWSSSKSEDVASSPTTSKQGACERRMGGYITEDPSLAAPERPKLAVTASSGTYVPAELPLVPLPRDMHDLSRLDGSVHAACNSSGPVKHTRWRGRRVVLVGHSVGAAGMIYTASTFPQLFESLVLVDPTIFPKEIARWPSTLALTTGAVTRRDKWASREEAMAAFAKNRTFFGRWHADVLRGYIDFGLRPASDGHSVTLKVNKMQEAYVFLDTDNIGSKRAFQRLARLPPSLNVHIIRADVGHSTVPEESYPAFIDIVKHATHVRISGSGHLIAQEKPQELGQELAGYFASLHTSVERTRAKL